MRRRCAPVVPVLTLCGVLAAPARAQQPFQFRYAPAVGASVGTLTEIRVVTTLTGFPAMPDGSVLEEETRFGAVQSVESRGADGYRVRIALDSVWTRRRAAEGPWKTVPDSTFARDPVEAVVTPRLAASVVAGGAPAEAVLRVLYGMVAGPGFAFPEAPVGVDSGFATGSRITTRVRVPPEAGLAVDQRAYANLTLTLDSVQRSDADEIAYLSFAGSFDPRAIAQESERGSMEATLGGSFAGRLVWSAAWNAVVSVAARLRVEGSFRIQRPGGVTDASAIWETTIRHRLRP